MTAFPFQFPILLRFVVGWLAKRGEVDLGQIVLVQTNKDCTRASTGKHKRPFFLPLILLSTMALPRRALALSEWGGREGPLLAAALTVLYCAYNEHTRTYVHVAPTNAHLSPPPSSTMCYALYCTTVGEKERGLDEDPASASKVEEEEEEAKESPPTRITIE